MPRGKTQLLAGGASISNAIITGSSSVTGSLIGNSSMLIGWTSSADPTTGVDTLIARSGAGNMKFANATQTYDAEASLGDSTHRLANVHTKQFTVGSSLAQPAMGIVTLSGAAGSASVQTTSLNSGSRIFLTHQNATGTPGIARVTSSTVSVGFTITSSSTTDTSVIAWWIVQTS